MLYLCNPCGAPSSPAALRIVEAMRSGPLGFIDTPGQRQARPGDVEWCADNGCFSKGFPGEAAWYAWLTRQAQQRDRSLCRFAVAPDVVGDAAATWERSAPWLPKIRELGLPAAFVAQNGLDVDTLDWSAFDVLFIGGDDEFKLGPAGREAIAAARAREIPVHMGRVNSYKRLAYAKSLGVSSCDGTFLRFHPTLNLDRVHEWFAKLDSVPGPDERLEL